MLRKCKDCGLEAHTVEDLLPFVPQSGNGYRYGRKNLCKVCQVARVRELRIRNRLRITEYMGGECQRCGLTHECWEMFDLHHRDPSEKEGAVSQMLGLKWDTIQKELDKCVLLCANCHRLTHWEERHDN